MIRTYFYTQIKPNDFDGLKKFCKPFTKDIFGASQEYIVAFESVEHAARAALQFLNQAAIADSQHPYRIILLLGEFTDSRPQEITIRIARSIHRRASPRNLYVTNEIVQKLNPEQATYEEKAGVMIKELQKEIPMFVLTRIDDIELTVDPSDLFDFSQVDSYSSVEQSTVGTTVPAAIMDAPTGPQVEAKLELDTPKNVPAEKKPAPNFGNIPMDSGKVNPVTSGKISPYSATQPAAPRPPSRIAPKERDKIEPQSQVKSLSIIAVIVLLVSIGGYLFSKNPEEKNVFQATPENSSELQIPVTPAPQANSQVTSVVKADPDVKIGYINVKTTPPGADVWIDGRKLSAKSPIDHWKVVSDRGLSIDASKTGYQKVSKKVMVGPLETMTVSFQLSPTKSKSTPKAKSTSKKPSSKTTKKPTTTKKKK